MPELPEVETVVISLRPFLLGKKITHLQILKEKSFLGKKNLSHCLKQKITAIGRRAKIIDFQFANHYHLLAHLKMTGQLLYQNKQQLIAGGHPTADFLQQLPGKHTRVIFTFNDGGQLFFNDLRIFGWLKIVPPSEIKQQWAKFGPDANQPLDPHQLQHQFSRRGQKIKVVLMDNHLVAGIGNIYANEILFESGLNPQRPAKNLTSSEVKKLARIIPQIINEAIKYHGTTFDGRYVDAQGKSGNYSKKLRVYGREGQPCLRCHTPLQQIKIAGRSSIYCERCQK